MCRLLAYLGTPILIEDLVALPEHSLVHQSREAHEAKTVTNGDGFGLGWYGERPQPGLYRETTPAWSDENLKSVCGQVRSRLFFAHVRASTGAATSRANCHPFVVGKYMFMHNGQIGGHNQIRRQVENLIPDDFYHYRGGTTDSEAVFLAAFGHGLEADPVSAIARTLAKLVEIQTKAGIVEPLCFAACLSDGESIWAFRWSSDVRPPSLYIRTRADGTVIGSEPVDFGSDWVEVPKFGYVVVKRGEKPVAGCLNLHMAELAAAA
jgi:glutamine amidotransferase